MEDVEKLVEALSLDRLQENIISLLLFHGYQNQTKNNSLLNSLVALEP